MKALLIPALLFTFATSTVETVGQPSEQPSGPKMDMTSPANLQYFKPGSTVSIAWKGPASHIGKAIQFSVWLYTLELYNYTPNINPVPLLNSLVDRQALGITTNATGTWTWKIPSDFKPGYYELYVSQGTDSDLFGDYWDRSRIYIKPELILTFDKRYGETLRVGSSQNFCFNLRGYDIWAVRVFFKKDGTILGRCPYVNYDPSTKRGVVQWGLTQYLTFSRFVLPKAGSGYSVFIGVLKKPFDYIVEGLTPDDFVDSDETDKFTLYPPTTLTISPTANGLQYMDLIIIGEPGARYNLYWSPSISPPIWRKWREVKATKEVFRVFDFAGAEACFYGIEEIRSLR